MLYTVERGKATKSKSDVPRHINERFSGRKKCVYTQFVVQHSQIFQNVGVHSLKIAKG